LAVASAPAVNELRAPTSHALTQVRQMRRWLFGESGYGVAYGSQISGRGSTHSDLDMFFTSPTPLDDVEQDNLTTAVVALHEENSFDIDTEVSYEAKLHVSRSHLNSAVSLGGFNLSDAGELAIPQVLVNHAYLNSPEFVSRLVLNALTTEHVFLGGDSRQYMHDRLHAERSTALLAVNMVAWQQVFRLDGLVRVITQAVDGAYEDDYLGFTDRPYVRAMLRRGLRQLMREEIVFPLTEGLYRPRPDVLRTALAELAAR
jgi:arginyl-tRNA synthetase